MHRIIKAGLIWAKYYKGKIIKIKIRMKNKALNLWSNWMKSYFGSKNYSSIEEYNKDHQVCPKCLSEEIQSCDCDCDIETWQELSRCKEECLDCGWKGLNKDLVPNSIIGKIDNSDLDELLNAAAINNK